MCDIPNMLMSHPHHISMLQCSHSQKITPPPAWSSDLATLVQVDYLPLRLALLADPREAEETKNGGLNVAVECKRANRLKFNPERMEVLLIEGRSDPVIGPSPVVALILLPGSIQSAGVTA